MKALGQADRNEGVATGSSSYGNLRVERLSAPRQGELGLLRQKEERLVMSDLVVIEFLSEAKAVLR